MAKPRLSLIVLPILVAAALLLAAPVWSAPYARQAAFLGTCAITTLIMAAIGIAVNGRLLGIIIDNRNRMSLSKFQACAWTVLVISAVATAANFNVAHGEVDALSFKIPQELLEAMGISAVSLAATPALLSLKAAQTPAPVALATATALLPPGQLNNSGKVMGNLLVENAQYADLFTGDEVGNFQSPDLGKIQQFLITILLVFVYGAEVAKSFYGSGLTKTLPNLDPSFVWLLGVSHASYLAYKAVPHTQSA